MGVVKFANIKAASRDLYGFCHLLKTHRLIKCLN